MAVAAGLEARLVSGEPQLAKYVNSGAALAAGEVIANGSNRAAVVHPTGIASGGTGNIAVLSGVWELKKNGTAGPVIALGEEVAWIAGTNLASDVQTGNISFGPCVEAAGASTDRVKALLQPRGSNTNPST